MSWKQSGKDDYNKVEIDINGKKIVHQSYDDKRGGNCTVTQTMGENGKEEGHTTVHGSGEVRRHGSHKD